MLRDQRGRCRTLILPCQEPSGGCAASAPLPAAEGWFCPQSLLSRQIISLGSVSSALSSHPDDKLTSQPAGCTIPAWWCMRAICQHRKRGVPCTVRAPPLAPGSTEPDSVPCFLPAADDIKPCPRCSAYIIKMNDGSCNHMTCAVCGCEFCWLCMKEISDLHYLRWGPEQGAGLLWGLGGVWLRAVRPLVSTISQQNSLF